MRDLLDNTPALDYLGGRGITVEDAALFRLGFTTGEDNLYVPGPSIVIPVLDYYERIISVSANLPERDPKYWHLHFSKQRWLWGLHLPPDPEKPPVLVEGQYDAIQLRRLGWPAYAVMGSTLSPYHAAHLRYLALGRRVLVYPDNDHRDLVEKVAAVVRGVGLTTLAPRAPYMPWDAPKADPDDLARNEPERLLTQLCEAEVVDAPHRGRR